MRRSPISPGGFAFMTTEHANLGALPLIDIQPADTSAPGGLVLKTAHAGSYRPANGSQDGE